jgi:hypothetical protein
LSAWHKQCTPPPPIDKTLLLSSDNRLTFDNLKYPEQNAEFIKGKIDLHVKNLKLTSAGRYLTRCLKQAQLSRR